MKSDRELLQDILSNPKIKHILIGEKHTDSSPKDLILDNMDLLVDLNKTAGRKVILMLEHLSCRDNYLLETVRNKKTLSPENELFLNAYNIYNKKFTALIKQALLNNIEVRGAENEFTNYSSSISHNVWERLENGNRSFAKELITASDGESLIIFLGGLAHLVNIYSLDNQLHIEGLQERVNHDGNTISWAIFDNSSLEQAEFFSCTQETSQVAIVPGFKNLQFDFISKRNPLAVTKPFSQPEDNSKDIQLPLAKMKKEETKNRKLKFFKNNDDKQDLTIKNSSLKITNSNDSIDTESDIFKLLK
jgi:hypothetical protein